MNNETNNDEKLPIFKDVQGAQKILNVYDDHITLTQIKNFRSILTSNWFKGTKKIYYSDIASIQYRNPTSLILGYIQFEAIGVASGDNFNSENSWTFEKDKTAIAQEIIDYVQKRIAESKNNKNNVATAFSPADELFKFKQLLDAGIITQQEFDEKKKQLLGL